MFGKTQFPTSCVPSSTCCQKIKECPTQLLISFVVGAVLLTAGVTLGITKYRLIGGCLAAGATGFLAVSSILISVREHFNNRKPAQTLPNSASEQLKPALRKESEEKKHHGDPRKLHFKVTNKETGEEELLSQSSSSDSLSSQASVTPTSTPRVGSSASQKSKESSEAQKTSSQMLLNKVLPQVLEEKFIVFKESTPPSRNDITSIIETLMKKANNGQPLHNSFAIVRIENSLSLVGNSYHMVYMRDGRPPLSFALKNNYSLVTGDKIEFYPGDLSKVMEHKEELAQATQFTMPPLPMPNYNNNKNSIVEINPQLSEKEIEDYLKQKCGLMQQNDFAFIKKDNEYYLYYTKFSSRTLEKMTVKNKQNNEFDFKAFEKFVQKNSVHFVDAKHITPIQNLNSTPNPQYNLSLATVLPQGTVLPHGKPDDLRSIVVPLLCKKYTPETAPKKFFFIVTNEENTYFAIGHRNNSGEITCEEMMSQSESSIFFDHQKFGDYMDQNKAEFIEAEQIHLS